IAPNAEREARGVFRGPCEGQKSAIAERENCVVKARGLQPRRPEIERDPPAFDVEPRRETRKRGEVGARRRGGTRGGASSRAVGGELGENGSVAGAVVTLLERRGKPHENAPEARIRGRRASSAVVENDVEIARVRDAARSARVPPDRNARRAVLLVTEL